MTDSFFPDVSEPIPYEGPESENPLAFRYYDTGRVVGDKTMAEHLRMAVCYWHSFAWGGNDVFGHPTFDRPWLDAASGSVGEQMTAAKHKMAAAFEFFTKLGVEYFCFHDADVAPAGATFAESCDLLAEMVDEAKAHMERTGVKLLWGTANLFSHPRYMAGAATNPDPEVFAYAAATVKHMLEQTHRLEGENYVLWGGREGYETLLNTDMGREMKQLARFMHLVVDHARSIGFDGTILIEPKPQEPTKHQYDYDSSTVHAFLVANGLADDIKVNIEVNHATLGGHSFEHEIAYAAAHGILGSVDANRGDPQNGWDTDQFPNSVEDMSLAMYRILRAGGLGTGGFNFDTKLRRQSIDRNDLFHGHIGGMDTLARSLLVANAMIQDGVLDGEIERRYAGWNGELGAAIHDGSHTMATLEALVRGGEIDPAPLSGGQERLENLVDRYIAATR